MPKVRWDGMGENLTQLPLGSGEHAVDAHLAPPAWLSSAGIAASPALTSACGRLPDMAMTFRMVLFLNFIVPSPLQVTNPVHLPCSR